MLLEEINDLAQAAKIIDDYHEQSANRDDVDAAVELLLGQRPDLAFTGQMFRIHELKDALSYKSVKDLLTAIKPTNHYVSFSQTENFRHYIDNLFELGIINSPNGMILTQKSTGLDVNKTLEVLRRGAYWANEYEILARVQNSTIHALYSEQHYWDPQKGRVRRKFGIFSPNQFNEWQEFIRSGKE